VSAVRRACLVAALLLAAAGCRGPAPAEPTAPPPETRSATPLEPVDVVVVEEIGRRAAPPLPVVCIDPGHPSEGNAGTTVQNGLREVEVVYDVAVELGALLEREGIARTVLTRDFRGYDEQTDVRVTNRRRAEIANEAGAALLLRLHCDTGSGRGFAVYHPDREGEKDGFRGPPESLRVESLRAAEAVHAGLAGQLGDRLVDGGVRGESRTYVGSRQGALTGSIHSRIPAVTVELVVLSHPEDAAFIGSDEGRRALAAALAAGVADYLAGADARPDGAGEPGSAASSADAEDP